MSITGRTRKKNSIRPYEFVLFRFDSQFHDRELGSITSDEILSFLNQITEGTKQSTKRSRYSCLASFFNFIKNAVDPIGSKNISNNKEIGSDERIFPLTYQGARVVVKKAGNLVGIHLRPHDLRRHAATHASRSGTPIEIVSKVIFRHANLSTTQRYLGKVNDTEALRWIENLYS
ncbi:MAG: site-specific integrase [Deltaproteobacteria bacterium]|nr:site-specific integrase [Deltaproteobacteria bacterium]